MTDTDKVKIAAAGERAALEIERLWNLDIIDPRIGSKDPRAARSLDEINRIIVRNGWGKPGDYKGDGSPQWCGMTAGDVWATAGLDPKWLCVWFASTDRLGAWARYDSFNGHMNPRPKGVDTFRLIQRFSRGGQLTFEPARGDIVIVGNGTRPAGNHVTVCVGYNPTGRTIDTISGNGGGVGPRGDRREGISRATYWIDSPSGYVPMFVIRPAPGDLLELA